MLPGKTLFQAGGARTFNGHTSSSATLQVTVAVTVTASGDFLCPLVVFKGKPGARIEKREFPTFPPENLYACQERAWMEKCVMRMWVRLVLKPYVEMAPGNIQPVLLLDSYRCHMMASIVNDIQDLGVEILHIPGGCTGLCQPVDIGIGNLLKIRAPQLWEEWIIDDQGVNNAASCPPSRLLLSLWITDSASRIKQSRTMVRNSWQHAEYSYFAENVLPPPAAAAIDVPEAERAEEEEAPAPAELPTRHQEAPPPPIHHRQEEQNQPELRRDPGWDDADDSNYEPLESSSDDD
jgi:hypothetical protein